MRGGDRDRAVAQELFCRDQAVVLVDQRAGLLAQRVQRFARPYPVGLQPHQHPVEDRVAPVVVIGRRPPRRPARRDDKGRARFGFESAQDFEDLRFDRNVADRVLRLDFEVFGRLDPDHARVELDRRPGQQIDLAFTQADAEPQQYHQKRFRIGAGELFSSGEDEFPRRRTSSGTASTGAAQS